MAEWLRRATQVRVEQSAWVRTPLLAFGFVFTLVQEDLCSLGFLHIKNLMTALAQVARRKARVVQSR